MNSASSGWHDAAAQFCWSRLSTAFRRRTQTQSRAHGKGLQALKGITPAQLLTEGRVYGEAFTKWNLKSSHRFRLAWCLTALIRTFGSPTKKDSSLKGVCVRPTAPEGFP